MAADEIRGGAGGDHAGHVEQQAGNHAGEESEDSFVLVDLNDGAEDRRVLRLASDELRHHPDGNYVERRGNDGAGSMDNDVALQLSLEALVIFLLGHVVFLALLHLHHSHLVGDVLAKMRRHDVANKLRSQTAITSDKSVNAFDVRN